MMQSCKVTYTLLLHRVPIIHLFDTFLEAMVEWTEEWEEELTDCIGGGERVLFQQE